MGRGAIAAMRSGARSALRTAGIFALVAASCSTPPEVAAPTGTGPRVIYDVQVDATAPAFNLATFTYFPNELSAHPGDTIRFTAVDRGEPHTVTFGTIIDDALATYESLPKNAPPPSPLPATIIRVPPPFVGQLPSTIDLRQSAWQPCFLARGDPPAKDACTREQQKQPELTGAQSWYNSGFLPGRAVFSVKLAADAKPGTYRYMCMFHQLDMAGAITIVDPTRPTPSADEAKAKGTEQLNKLVQALDPALAEAKAKVTPGEVLAGTGATDPTVLGGVTEFFPKTASVPVGGSLIWRPTGHTLSFNAPADAVDLVVKATDGSYHLNNKAIFAAAWPGTPIPANSAPGLDSPPGGPPAPPPAPAPGASAPVPTLDAGAWDGKGFRSSGLVFRILPKPQVLTYRVTFTQPGTYTYRCLIHVDMEGTVKVGP